MSRPEPGHRLLRASLLLAGGGAVASLALFVRPGPYSLVLFMFLGQPLLLLAFVLFGVVVLRDLRSKRVL